MTKSTQAQGLYVCAVRRVVGHVQSAVLYVRGHILELPFQILWSKYT